MEKKDSLKSKILLIYRLAILGLLCFVGALSIISQRQFLKKLLKQEPTVSLVNLSDRISHWSRKTTNLSNISEVYFSSDETTVHMHLMGYKQLCPLHLHRETHEATIIVSGNADVLQIYGRDGNLDQLKDIYGPGSLIASPPFCGHEWENKSADKLLGNLVIASPPFQGNNYLREDDKRLTRETKPFSYNPDEQLKSFLTQNTPFQLDPLPIMSGKISALLVKDKAILESNPKSRILMVITRGKGSLIYDKEYPIRTSHLVTVRNDSQKQAKIEISANQDTPMAIFVLNP